MRFLKFLFIGKCIERYCKSHSHWVHVFTECLFTENMFSQNDKSCHFILFWIIKYFVNLKSKNHKNVDKIPQHLSNMNLSRHISTNYKKNVWLKYFCFASSIAQDGFVLSFWLVCDSACEELQNILKLKTVPLLAPT